MLEAIKAALGITGDYLDATLTVYINEINEYLKSAGVPAELIGTQATFGVVARGVTDLWNYGSSGGNLSPYFKERVIQMTAGAKNA